MSPRIGETELRRRAIEGVRDEVEAFGCAAITSKLIRRNWLTAAVVPASPQRSLFNSVHFDEPEALAEHVDSLAGEYDASGVRAWTVWVPDEDRESARLLAARGHVLDAAPRAMAMELAEQVTVPPAPAGVAPGPIDAAACATLNDLACWLLRRALREAGEEGLISASLQATRAGAPLYERLGFRDFGYIEMWELRR